ncbi:MAG: hypothetical protein QM737_15590 [Ferruginibacter sp.]
MAGTVPFIVLGTIHLFYTFFTNKFSARNAIIDEEMKNAFPVLTKETTIWKAWIGFNASHASGAMFIGIINLLIAVQYDFILKNFLFLALNIFTVLFYLGLAKKYWFRIPFIGILLSAICFITAAAFVFIG